MAILVKTYEAGHRHGSHLQSEEEHQEMSGRHHHKHTEQGALHKHVELTGLERGVRTGKPLAGLNANDKRTGSKDGFHHRSCLGGHIHSAESLNLRIATGNRSKADDGQDEHHHRSEHVQMIGIIVLLLFLQVVSEDEIHNKGDDEHQHQAGLGNHIKELSVVHNYILAVKMLDKILPTPLSMM